MAEIKNFGMAGVGPTVQLGKGGPNLVANGSVIEARDHLANSLVIMRAAPAVGSQDVVTLAQLNASIGNASSDAFHLILGNALVNTGALWASGAIALSDNLTVSNAVEEINTVLGKLVPSAPPNFPNGSLTVTSTGSSPVLANGVFDNSGSSTLAAGQAVTRVTANAVTNTLLNNGPGNSGTLTAFVNSNAVGSHTLTGSSDVGTYGALVISGQSAYPASTPGFWTTVNTSVNASAVTGVNDLYITDSAAGTTNVVYFVKDSLTTTPSVTLGTVAQASAGTLAYSSSVPHYGTGATLTLGCSISNLAGQTYFNGNPLSSSATNNIMSGSTFSYTAIGVATPIPQNTTAATAITPVTVSVNGTNVAAVGKITLTAQNVNGTGNQQIATNILVKNGTTTGVDELNIPVSGLGSAPNNNNAVRVGTAGGDTPSDAVTAWVANAALQLYDAAVVGGVLSCNQTNYSTGYLPVGPNLTTQNSTQYVTFSFDRSAVSTFNIVVTGTYAGCWIALPGVSDNATISPNALGGAWWTAFASYTGAGVPGMTGDSVAGCALGSVMNGGSGTFQITFGTQSSTNATGNQILVRFRLNAGQSISALSFT